MECSDRPSDGAPRDRYAYEVAEEVLDAFAFRRELPEGFLAAYHRFKTQILALALVDHAHVDRQTALARAWETAEVAFDGYATGAMAWAASELWVALPGDLHGAFHKAVTHALRLAAAYTPRRAPRMYARRYRRGLLPVGHLPVRRVIAAARWPVSVPSPSEGATWVEAALNDLRAARAAFEAPRPSRRGGHLRLV